MRTKENTGYLGIYRHPVSRVVLNEYDIKTREKRMRHCQWGCSPANKTSTEVTEGCAYHLLQDYVHR